MQRIRWIPARRMLFYEVLLNGPAPGACHLELHRERAYWPRDVARWLMDAGFVLRDVKDAASMRSTVDCPRRIVVVAQKLERAPPGESQRQFGLSQA